MVSPRLLELNSQIATLRRNFLPARFSPVGIYGNPTRVSARTLAYRVLAHAEIEHYLEDRCLEVAQNARNHWVAGGFSRVIGCIALFSGIAFQQPPDSINRPPKVQKDWNDLVAPNGRIEAAFSQYVYFAKEKNHGIREANLASLLIPLGIDVLKIDPDLVSRLDAFGKKRGSAAHTSMVGAVKQGVDPKAEFSEVGFITQKLISLDFEFDNLISGLK